MGCAAESLPTWLTLCHEVIEEATAILVPSSEETPLPSFADMDLSVASKVGGQADDDAPASDVAVFASQDHMYLLSFAWTALRSASGLLASLVIHEADMLAGQACVEADATAACETFVRVLRTSRHRGVIEAFALALSRIVSHLASASTSAVQRLPLTWLDTSIEALADVDKFGKLSVTRRSAGLPYIIQSLLQLPPKLKPAAVKHALERLLEVAGSSAVQPDLRSDPPQVGCYLPALAAKPLRIYADPPPPSTHGVSLSSETDARHLCD
jgi:hypothetical protein